MVLLAGFSEGDDVRNPSNITELKRLATEQGKVCVVLRIEVQLKDMKYIEIGKEKRLFLQFANSYSASIVALRRLLHCRRFAG